MRNVSASKFGVKLLTVLALVLSTTSVLAQAKEMVNLPRDVSLDQRLDEQVPLDIPFKDETGKPVKTGDYFGKRPVLLMMPFYRCRGSCALELEGLLTALNKVKYTTGKDFDVVIASIHPKETPEMAMSKKKQVLEFYKKHEGQEGWHFLTGSWDSIQKLTKSVGFRFVYDEEKDQIAHPAGFMVITPQGKLSRYFYGVNYDPKALSLSVVEAGENKIGSVVDKITLFCSSFDMVKGKYTLSVVRLLQVLGVSTALILFSSVGFMLFRYRRTALYKDSPELQNHTPTSA